MIRNLTGQKYSVFAWNILTGLPVTGDTANITANIRIDDGAATALTDVNPVEQEDGFYVFDLTATEVAGHKIAIFPESSTVNVRVIGCPATVYTVRDTTGLNAVTFNIKDNLGVNIPDVWVEVWDQAGTAFISRTITDTNGNATFNLGTATYTIKMHKAGYYFANQTPAVDTTETIPYTGTVLVPSAPADPEMCRVYGFFLNPDGTIITGLTGNALVLSYQEDNTIYAGTEAGTYVTTGTYAGMMYFDLARGASATITLDAINYSKAVTVPELDTEELKNL